MEIGIYTLADIFTDPNSGKSWRAGGHIQSHSHCLDMIGLTMMSCLKNIWIFC